MREKVATHAVGNTKLDSAAHQLAVAAEELEHAFEPARRILKDRFGEEVGEEFYVSAGECLEPKATGAWAACRRQPWTYGAERGMECAGHAAKLRAVQTAVHLVEAASQNIYKSKQCMDVMPGLRPEEVHSLSGSLKELLSKHSGAFDDIGARKLVRDCVNTIHVAKSQTIYAAQ